MPVTDIVRTGDKALVPQEGMRKASGGKVSFHMPIVNSCSTCLNYLPACAMKQLLLEQCGFPHQMLSKNTKCCGSRTAEVAV